MAKDISMLMVYNYKMRPSFSDVGNNFKSGEQKTKKLVN
jgi:hypothetical protein